MRHRHTKRLAAFIVALVCAVGIAQPVPKKMMTAQAATLAELEAQKEENNKKIKEYEEKLGQYSASQKKEQEYQAVLTEKIGAIEENLTILDTELTNIQTNLAQADAQIASLENTIAVQELEIENGLKEFKLRLRAMYINGNDSLASALVGATDFYDLLSKYELISCVARHDDELVNNLKNELEDYHSNLASLEQQKADYELQQEDLTAKQTEMKSNMGSLQAAYAESESEQKRLEEERAKVSQSIESLEERNRLADEAEEEIRAQIQRAAEEAKKRAAEKAAAEAKKKQEAEEAAKKAEADAAKKAAAAEEQRKAEEAAKAAARSTTAATTSGSTSSTQPATLPPTDPPTSPPTDPPTEPPTEEQIVYDDSSFIWPCPGHYYISSPYGYRWGTLHKGVDIADNQGADVVASRSGTVISAVDTCVHNYGKESNCCGNGYGNHVIIQHDDGTYSTLYGHMASIVVSEGDYVTKGTTIGYVGTTGWSTGYHLHFEIRVDGTPVDPADYLNY